MISLYINRRATLLSISIFDWDSPFDCVLFQWLYFLYCLPLIFHLFLPFFHCIFFLCFVLFCFSIVASGPKGSSKDDSSFDYTPTANGEYTGKAILIDFYLKKNAHTQFKKIKFVQDRKLWQSCGVRAAKGKAKGPVQVLELPQLASWTIRH